MKKYVLMMFVCAVLTANVTWSAVNWTGTAGDHDLSNPANWSGAPAGETLAINTNVTGIVLNETSQTPSLNVGYLYFAQAGAPSMELTVGKGGTLTATGNGTNAYNFFGNSENSNARVIVDGGTIYVKGESYVAQNHSKAGGTVTIQNGGSYIAGQRFTLGRGVANVELKDGTFTVYGTANGEQGGTARSTQFELGHGSNSAGGRATFTQTGGTANILGTAGIMYGAYSYAGTATYNISAGTLNTTKIQFGTGTANFNLSGSGIVNCSGGIADGITLKQNGGTMNLSGSGTVNYDEFRRGTVNISGSQIVKLGSYDSNNDPANKETYDTNFSVSDSAQLTLTNWTWLSNWGTSSGTLTQTGGKVTTNGFFIAQNSTKATGTVALSGGEMTANGYFWFGRGKATLNVSGSAKLTTTGDFAIGHGYGTDATNSIATVNQSNGTVNAKTVEFADSKYAGVSTYNLSGGTLATGRMFVDSADATSTFHVKGGAADITSVAGQGLEVNTNLTSGRLNSIYTTGDWNKVYAGNVGALDIYNSTLTVSNISVVDGTGTPTINVQNGAKLNFTSGVAIGGRKDATTPATLNVLTGGSVTFSNGQWTFIGGGAFGNGQVGNGLLCIDGGTVNAPYQIYVAQNDSSTVGKVELKNGSFTAGTFTVGRGKGDVVISGGTFTTNNAMRIGHGNASNATNSFATVTQTGGIANYNGEGLNLADSDVYAGTSIYNMQGGTLNTSTIFRDANAATARFNLSGGTVNVTNGISVPLAMTDGTLNVGTLETGALTDGTFTQRGGTLSPGGDTAIGTTTIKGKYTAESGKILMNVTPDGADQIIIQDPWTIGNAVLELDVSGSVEDYTLVDLFEFGKVEGVFDNIIFTNPETSEWFNMGLLYTTGQIGNSSYVPEPATWLLLLVGFGWLVVRRKR